MDILYFLNQTKHILVPLLIFAVSIGVAYFAGIIIRIMGGFVTKTRTTLDDELIAAVKKPVFLAVISIGAYISLNVYNPDIHIKTWTLSFIFSIIWIIIAAFACARLLKAFFNWYVEEIYKKTRGKTDNTIFRFLRKILITIVYAIALMVVLDKAGIEISPLLAGLGIAGLAVALALEDTLSNFFSAVYIAADRPVKINDYVKIDDEIKGFVEDVGWRSTKIRTIGNNLIIIPNNKLAQSTIINYNNPEPQMSVIIPVGVSYDSDLEKVEKITIQTAKKVLEKTDVAVKDFEPFIRYNEFADSSINFSVILRVKNFEDNYLLKHEFIKALHKEFNKNKIEIPFPQIDVHNKK